MPEMETLAKGNLVESKLTFPSGQLSFKIQPTYSDAQVDLIDDVMFFDLPHDKLRKIHNSDEVGFRLEFETDTEEVLSLLFEKDFKCLTSRNEDESSLYKNPSHSH